MLTAAVLERAERLGAPPGFTDPPVRLSADTPAGERVIERLTATTSSTGAEGSIATTVSDKIWAVAFSQLAWLRLVTSERTPRGGPHRMYRFEVFAGNATADKPWGSSVTARAEGARIAAADPTLSSVEVGDHKSGWQTIMSSEAETDVKGLAAKLVELGGLGLSYDCALQIVTGDGATEGTGFRTELAKADYDDRKVVSAAAPTADILDEVFHLVPAAARMDPTCCWLSSDANAQAIRKSVRGMDYFDVTAGSYADGAAGTLLGHPFYVAPGFEDFSAANDVTLLFGPLSALAARYAGDFRIERTADSPQVHDTDQVSYRFLHRFDSDVISPDVLAFTSGS